ncbi:MAG: metal-dependent hydrolase [Clostridia bacterium]|nr:metal-dependent hydrolase [Clostridia bacterium]
MQCRTHIAFGIAASTALVHTGDLKVLLTTIAGATIGSIISDLDSYNSEISQILNKITAIIVATVLVSLGISYIFKIDIIDKIVQYKNAANILIGVLVFLLVSILGSYTKHRTFMHSIPCVLMYFVILSTFLSQSFTLPFVVSMVAHIALDLFNHIGVVLFCPISEKRICFDLCDSDGIVNSILFYVSVFIAAYMVTFVV